MSAESFYRINSKPPQQIFFISIFAPQQRMFSLIGKLALAYGWLSQPTLVKPYPLVAQALCAAELFRARLWQGRWRRSRKCSFKKHRNKYCFLIKLIKSRKTSFLLELHRGQQILLVESKTQKVKVGYFLTLVSQTTMMMSHKLSH